MVHDSTKKTPSQDAQGRSYEFVPSTPDLTGANDEAVTKMAPVTRMKRKKKCYGNRKAQRQRRKSRLRAAKNKRHRNEPDTDGEEEEEHRSMQVSLCILQQPYRQSSLCSKFPFFLL